jgi:hypothetical protein
MSVYLDRFLNTPPVRLPKVDANGAKPDEVLARLLPLLDRQQQVNESKRCLAELGANSGDVQCVAGLDSRRQRGAEAC